MRFASLAILASASMLAAAPASAQAPLPQKNVSMAMSLAIIQATLDRCTKDGYKVSVVIVD
ncbi:MAG: heme-binding protein, partial [Bradyrhizobium sp.]|nr:heme-binding protein [Bradyrhizobium sp.]